MKKTLTFSLLLAAALAAPVLAQEDTGRMEIGVSAIGGFPAGSVANGVRQTATDSGGVLASFRYLFTGHQGVEVDYGYTRDTQQFNSLAIGSSGVQTDMHEVSASYVFRFAMKRLKPFVSAGAGGVVFDPVPGSSFLQSQATTQAKAAFVYSAGADFTITSHLLFRAQYRGLVFDAPGFGTGMGSNSALNFSEPAGGLVWHF